MSERLAELHLRVQPPYDVIVQPARPGSDRLPRADLAHLKPSPGNRSILASPLDDDVVRRLNAEVKFREPFRPFAPVVLADKAPDYFTLDSRLRTCRSPAVSPNWPRSDPSVVHVNGTARVQTVTRIETPAAEVLEEFEECGCPVLINTSLKSRQADLRDAGHGAGLPGRVRLDGLLIEDWWVTSDEDRYSFWGFLGDGIVDTPDGGRCHRRTLIGRTRCSRPRHRLPAGRPRSGQGG